MAFGQKTNARPTLYDAHMIRAMSSVNQMKGEGICTVDKTQARLEPCGLHSKGRLLALPMYRRQDMGKA
jgi:hypothetical protein